MPYRADPRAESQPLDKSERELFVVAAVLWVASVSRVVFAFARHETFGAIATLAFVVVVAFPIAALRHRQRR
jgi:hypothetical protein